MAELKNYYRILQVDPGAEPEVVTAAYKQLALKYHPDTSQSADATRKMQELNEAYAVVSEPATRAQYDRERNRQQAMGRQADRQAREWAGQGGRGEPDLQRQAAARAGRPGTQSGNQQAREQAAASSTRPGTERTAPQAERSKSDEKMLAFAWAVSFAIASVLLYRLFQLVLPSIWSNSPWWWLGLALPPMLGVLIAVAVAFRLEAFLRKARRPEPE
jgi:curved DNA-binding protein CbpA